MPLATGTRIGPYEILGWLGGGGMGNVYRARDPRLERDVAIKRIREAADGDSGRVRRFEQKTFQDGRASEVWSPDAGAMSEPPAVSAGV